MTGRDHPIIETDEEKREREKKRAYLDALPEYPNFVLPNDKVDALLPSAKVKSWEDLLKILQGSDFTKTKNDLVYRGHAGHDWQLESTLGRLFKGADIPNDKREKLLRQFKLSMRGRGYDLGPLPSDEEIWAVGQHHGLKTPLLDWTRSPFVALFFAFSKYENHEQIDGNPSRAIFCLNKTQLEEDLSADFAEALFLEPEDHRNSRLVNQSGLFTIAPGEHDNLVSVIVSNLDEYELLGSVDETETEYKPSDPSEDSSEPSGSPETLEVRENTEDALSFEVSDKKRAQLLSRYIFKLHIPNSIDDRKGCLEALRQMNIHHGNLFPDPGGASEFCNDWLERLLEDEKQEKRDDAKKEDDRKIAAAVTSEPTTNVTDDVRSILNAHIEASNDDINDLALDVNSSVEKASSLDWQKFAAKRVLVKRAISQAIARSPGNFKPGRKPDELIDLLLEKYRATANGSS